MTVNFKSIDWHKNEHVILSNMVYLCSMFYEPDSVKFQLGEGRNDFEFIEDQSLFMMNLNGSNLELLKN